MSEAGEQGPKIGSGMRVLKIAVVAMGVLIVAGTTTLIVLIVRKLTAPGSLRPAATTALEEPAGSRVVGMTRVANGLAVALHGGGEGDRIVVIDPASGRVLQRIRVTR